MHKNLIVLFLKNVKSDNVLDKMQDRDGIYRGNWKRSAVFHNRRRLPGGSKEEEIGGSDGILK
jgi:hypothetical protein